MYRKAQGVDSFWGDEGIRPDSLPGENRKGYSVVEIFSKKGYFLMVDVSGLCNETNRALGTIVFAHKWCRHPEQHEAG